MSAALPYSGIHFKMAIQLVKSITEKAQPNQEILRAGQKFYVLCGLIFFSTWSRHGIVSLELSES